MQPWRPGIGKMWTMQRILKLSVFALLLGVFQVYAAQLIMPSGRVSTQLNVRASPNTSSAVVGKLKPREAALLVSSQPGWYAVRLDDGTQGFVSKGWSDEVNALRLGEWNLKKLGHGNSKDYATVSRIIKDDFDVLAVVEVMQKQHGHPGYDALMQALGPDWQGVITATPRPNDPSDGNAEFYAIVYRQGAVHLCNGWTGMRYVPDGDGHPGETAPDIFSREPAYTCLAADNGAGHVGTDFLLAAYHAKWAGGNQDEIAAEVKHLDAAFTAMAAALPGEKDLLVVGDFNLVPEVLDTVVAAADRTSGTGSTLNLTGSRTGNLYDHLLVHDPGASRELLGNARVLDVRDRAASPHAFYRQISDHLPIRAYWSVPAADDD